MRMSIDHQSVLSQSPALEFKSSTFSVPVLVLSSNDMADITQQLQDKIQKAPEFFKNSPVVFDLQELNRRDLEIDVDQLVDLLKQNELLPIGVRGGTSAQNLAALELAIPIHWTQTSAATAAAKPQKQAKPVSPPAPEPTGQSTATLLINQPVRSGQRVYAHGDLVILAQVSAGAEIMAEGNIHVYAPLRGRALAGVQGNPDSRIFCFDLQAELISIAGHYKISEDLDDSVRGKPVQIYLQEQSLIIKDL